MTLLAAACVAAWLAAGPADAQTVDGESKAEITELKNIDLPGSDFRQLRGVTLERCKSACLGQAQCQAFTYNVGARVCFLKKAVPEQEPFRGAVSGIKQESAADEGSQAETLIEDWRQADERCRADQEGASEAAAWCEVRSALGVVLQLQDWCHGKQGEPAAQRQWHECDVASIRVEIPKAVSSPDKYIRSDAPLPATSPRPSAAGDRQGQSPGAAKEATELPRADGQPESGTTGGAGGTPQPADQPQADEPVDAAKATDDDGGAPQDAGQEPEPQTNADSPAD